MPETLVCSLSVEDIPKLMAFESQVFPTFMQTSVEVYAGLVQQGGILVEYRNAGLLIGAAFAVPAVVVEQALQSRRDPSFYARMVETYSCMEGVLPLYQRQGIGTKLLEILARAAKVRGYQRLSAHVRQKDGWAQKRAEVLGVTERRDIPEFWEEPDEFVEYQLCTLERF